MPLGDRITLTVAANNLFDVAARRHASFLKDHAPLAGRDIRLSVRTRFCGGVRRRLDLRRAGVDDRDRCRATRKYWYPPLFPPTPSQRPPPTLPGGALSQTAQRPFCGARP